MSIPIFELRPHNYEHGKGLVEALDASQEHLRQLAGTSFVEGHEEVAKALRETLAQFMTARERIVSTWRERWPEPPEVIMDEFDSSMAAEHGGNGIPPAPRVRTKEPRRPTRR